MGPEHGVVSPRHVSKSGPPRHDPIFRFEVDYAKSFLELFARTVNFCAPAGPFTVAAILAAALELDSAKVLATLPRPPVTMFFKAYNAI